MLNDFLFRIKTICCIFVFAFIFIGKCNAMNSRNDILGKQIYISHVMERCSTGTFDLFEKNKYNTTDIAITATTFNGRTYTADAEVKYRQISPELYTTYGGALMEVDKYNRIMDTARNEHKYYVSIYKWGGLSFNLNKLWRDIEALPKIEMQCPATTEFSNNATVTKLCYNLPYRWADKWQMPMPLSGYNREQLMDGLYKYSKL